MIYRYVYPEMFDGFERVNFKQHSGNIILWGAGKLGSVVAHVLMSLGIDFIAFVDTNPEKHKTIFCNHKVISPAELTIDHSSAVVIVSTIHRNEVIDKLKEHGYPFFDAWSLLLEIDWNGYDYMNTLYMERMVNYYFWILSRDLKLKRKYFVSDLILNITNRCTLRCEDCSTFIPFVEHPRDFNKGDIVSDAMNVIDAIGQFRELHFFGGEPLLHQELLDLICAFKDINSFTHASIITNGTIIPSTEVVTAIKDEKRISVRISDYGKLSSKQAALMKLLTDNKIKYEIIDYKNWYKKAEIRKYNDTEAELRRKFCCCMGGSPPCISNGKLFLCKICMTLCEMNIFPESEDNYLNLVPLRNIERSERNTIIRKYIERIYTDNYIDACRYCSGKVSMHYENIIPPAVQATGTLKLEKIKS